jgi:hypothetical protein
MMVAKPPPEPELVEPSSSAEPLPNWLRRRLQRDAELEAANERGRELANRYPAPPQRVYVGTLRRPRRR